MLTIKTENKTNEKDIEIIEAFKIIIKRYNDFNIENLWQEVKECKFLNHDIGRGGNHIWISRKTDKERIAIIQ